MTHDMSIHYTTLYCSTVPTFRKSHAFLHMSHIADIAVHYITVRYTYEKKVLHKLHPFHTLRTLYTLCIKHTLYV